MSESAPPFPNCPHFKDCAGCGELLSFTPPSIWNEVLSFFVQSNIPNLHVSSPLHWRCRAKVAVRGTAKTPLIGLFKRFSHDVLPIPDCLVHHPNLNQAFEIVRKWVERNEIIPYQENGGGGELRYLQGVVQRTTGHVQLSFVLNATQSSAVIERWFGLIKTLANEYPFFWHSLWINFNNKPTNTIFGVDWVLVWGEKYLWEKFGETDVCYGPASFGQANLVLFEQMLFRIRELLNPRAKVAEFYAGVGVIGLFIASCCEWVRCSEINPFAKAYFHQGYLKLSPSIASHLSFITASTEEALSTLEGATTVIVDPPRKGLDACFFPALKKNTSVDQLLYISCGWEGFKKDFQRLSEDGWVVQSVDGYLFFPGTNHVELLVNLKKSE